MDEIAAEAGVARSTVYVYFANRDELLRACLQSMHQLLLGLHRRVVGADAAPVERLRTLSAGMLERIDETAPSSGWPWPPRGGDPAGGRGGRRRARR